MNVLRLLFATLTHSAITPWEVTTVLVSLGLKAMEQDVMVIHLLWIKSDPSITVMMINTDINECVVDTHNCDSNGICINEVGSFGCMCSPGYSGNGTYCEGKGMCCACMQVHTLSLPPYR